MNVAVTLSIGTTKDMRSDTKARSLNIIANASALQRHQKSISMEAKNAFTRQQRIYTSTVYGTKDALVRRNIFLHCKYFCHQLQRLENIYSSVDIDVVQLWQQCPPDRFPASSIAVPTVCQWYGKQLYET